MQPSGWRASRIEKPSVKLLTSGHSDWGESQGFEESDDEEMGEDSSASVTPGNLATTEVLTLQVTGGDFHPEL